MNQRFLECRKKLILSVAINGLVPVILYAVLRPHFANDASALAAAGLVPAAWTVAVWIVRRRGDWIGAMALLGFVLAVAGSILSGGNALLLKVHDSWLIGTIGLVLLVSAVIGKPLLLPIIRLTLLPLLLSLTKPLGVRVNPLPAFLLA